jgi:hypothetical protein
MLKKYYNHATVKDGEAKKDGGDGDAGGFPAVENVFLIFGGPTVDKSNSQRKRERSPCCGEGSSLLPRLVGGCHHL